MNAFLHRSILCACVGIAITGAAAAAPAEEQAKAARFEKTLDGEATSFRRFIVFHVDPKADEAAVASSLSHASAMTSIGLRVVRRLASDGWLVEATSALDRAGAGRLMRELAMHDEIAAAHPDYVYRATTADPNLFQQWHLTGITDSIYDCLGACVQAGANVTAGWSYGTGAGMVIAVIDTGYTDHPDLTPNLAAANATTGKVGYDFLSAFDQNDPAIGDPVGPDANAHDPGDYLGSANSNWHGTHVMGLAAAAYNNGLYGAGVAPSAKLLPIRVLGAGGGQDSDIEEAIVWASGGIVDGRPYNSTPARVLNLSLGVNYACPAGMQMAINKARQNGSIVVVAAGNSNINVSNVSPASCAGVVTVAATGYNGGVASAVGGVPYSNYGAGVALAAPGGGWIREVDVGYTEVPIFSDWNTGAHTPGSPSFYGIEGTSMAAPLVAGLAASIASLKPWLSPDQIKTQITSHTHPWGTGGVPTPSVPFGSGLMDAAATLAAVSTIAPPAAATMTATPNPVVVPAGSSTGSYTVSWNAPGYATLDAYVSVNGGARQYAGLTAGSGSSAQTITVGQSVTWYLYPHGRTPTTGAVKSVTVTAHN